MPVPWLLLQNQSSSRLSPSAPAQHRGRALIYAQNKLEPSVPYKPSTTCQVPQSKGFSLSLTLLRHFPLLPVYAFRAESCLPNRVTPTVTQPDQLHGLISTNLI